MLTEHNQGSLRERASVPHRYLHSSALVSSILCSRFHPPRSPVQDCAAGVCWLIDWSLHFAGVSHDIPMLADCICLEQGNLGRALHQYTRHVDRSRPSDLGRRCVYRRTPVAYDLETPDNESGEDCHQRPIPFGVIVRFMFSQPEVFLLTGNSITVVNLIRLPQLIYVGLDDLTCSSF